MRFIPNRINTKIALLFISQTLVFSNPRLLSSFVPAAFEDVLSGLPTSEQPYDHGLRRVPLELAVLGFQRGPACTGQTGRRYRSDRSAQGFAGVDHFDDRSRVLAHSSVLARFCVNTSRGSNPLPCAVARVPLLAVGPRLRRYPGPSILRRSSRSRKKREPE